MNRHLPAPFAAAAHAGEDQRCDAARQWLHQTTPPFQPQLPAPPSAAVSFEVRVIALEEPIAGVRLLCAADLALLQLLFAARQRLTARLSAVNHGFFESARTPPENPIRGGYDQDSNEETCPRRLYTELSLLHAQLRSLTAAHPQLGMYNEAWVLFQNDIRAYAPWFNVNLSDAGTWQQLVLRQQAQLVEYAQHAADFRRAQGLWPSAAAAAGGGGSPLLMCELGVDVTSTLRLCE